METPEVSDAETKHLADIGLTAEGVCRKTYVPDQIKADDEKRTATFVISTGAVDRDNDTIKVEGWDVKNYLRNPVVLFAHRSDLPPVAKAVSVVKSSGTLKATAEFPAEGVYDLADTVYSMVKGGFLRATSVGFRPKRDKAGRPTMTWNEERGGMDFEEQELLEFSVVPVPSNPEALLTQAKDFAGAQSVGLDLGPIQRALDIAHYVGNPKVSERFIEKLSEEATVSKAGRRLSAKTEGYARSAHKAVTEAAGHLTSLLGDDPDMEPDDDPDDKAPEPALIVTASPKPETFLVNPEDVKAAVVAAVNEAAKSAVNRARGRLD